MKRKLFLAGAFYSLLITGFLWLVFGSGNAHWLKIKAHNSASQNNHFNVMITLEDPPDGKFLGVDIHLMTDKKISGGYLTGCRAVKIYAAQSTYEFSIKLPDGKLSPFIFPVIYISGDGTWRNRILSAEGSMVPVKQSDCVPSPLQMVSMSATDTTGYSIQPASDSNPIKIFSSIAWIASALLFSRISVKLAAITGLTALWETSGLSILSIDLIRSMAETAGVYSQRKTPQQFAAIIVIAVFVCSAVYIISSADSLYKSSALAAITIFWTVSLLQIISLHVTDLILYTGIAGSNTAQLIRFISALICLISILHIMIKPSAKNTVI